MQFLSRSLGFSKTESRGTLLMICIIFLALIATNWRIKYLKESIEYPKIDTAALAWLEATQQKISIKKSDEAPPFSQLSKPKILPKCTCLWRYDIYRTKVNETGESLITEGDSLPVSWYEV